MRLTRTSVTLAVLAAAAAGNVQATIAARMPAERHHGTITFITGGHNPSQTPVFERAAADYPLALEFVRRGRARDQLLAGARVSIRDARGREILSTVTEGPFLFARVPAGRYHVAATYDGMTLTRRVVVRERDNRRVVLEWPADA